MPWPETTVPKFGEWDGSEDLSYSIVFDKARADKERFMHTLKNDSKDSSLNEQEHKTPGLIAGKEASPTMVKRTLGTGRTELSANHYYQSANEQKTHDAIQSKNYDTPNRGYLSSGQQPRPILSTKDSTTREMVARADGSNFHVPRDGVQRVPRPTRQTHQQYLAAAKITRSQGCSETASIGDLPEKINLPKFGDWDASDSKAGDGFSIIFDRARDEKKSNVSRKTPSRFISPLRPAEDLYKDSQGHKKKRGWLNTLCCVDRGE